MLFSAEEGGSKSHEEAAAGLSGLGLSMLNLRMGGCQH